jgi:large subunit ribosomal protein L25
MANDRVELHAEARTRKGKGVARKLRRSGMAPAVLYGDGEKENTLLSVPERVVDYNLQHFGDNVLYDLHLGSQSSTVRILNSQRDPVSRQLLHVDFVPVNMRERIEITVPLSVVGEAPGVKEEDGVLQQILHEVQAECLPGNIPQELELDVSGLQMGGQLTLESIELPEGVELVSDHEEIAVTITTPTQISEEELEAAGVVEVESEEEESAEEVVPEEPSEEAAEGESEE